MKIAEVDSFEFEERGQAPGQAINVKSSEGTEVQYTRETEFYQLPGFASGPTKKDQVILLPIEGGYEVIVASHNYRIGVSVTAGQVKVFSTNASGSEKKAELFLDSDGEITLSTGDASLNIKPDGETILDSDSENITLRTSGKVIVDQASAVEFMGNTKTLVTHTELNTALQAMVSAINSELAARLAGSSPPGTVSIDISLANATKLKTG